MTNPQTQIQNQFICPKCRGRQADVREIILSKARLLDIIPSKDTRYLEVTCQLCGYTEFYNRAIYAQSLARQANEIPEGASVKQEPKPNRQ